MYISVLPPFVSGTMCTLDALKPKEELALLELELHTDSGKQLCGCWQSNLGPVEEQPVFLTISSAISGVLNHLGRPLSLPITLFFQ